MSALVLRILHQGEHAYVQVDYAALTYGASVEIAGWRLSQVTGMPISSYWCLIDVREVPELIVGDTETWTPPSPPRGHG
ncbi:hypothetical protein [Micromonospora sp. WMMD1082]|uniref:hypothetical protein n=1 Tax=Micromonospora sp. WMMD1082 TaxID=3016104 RepID=UPI00241798C6|nr:hypothetical protein [Micromonospora sp. WMMD1082]MDG4797383.1 hypothetical protein [Micromonospora sp. WMMD1082]